MSRLSPIRRLKQKLNLLLATLFIALQMPLFVLTPKMVHADGNGSPDACLNTTANVLGSQGGSDNPGGSEDLVVVDVGAGNIVSGVCIKSGSNMFGGNQHSGVLGNGTYEDNCYTVTGVGTQTVTVTRIGSGPDCQGISHIDVVTKPVPTTVEVIKKLNPTDDDGLFNLRVEGVTHAANVGHNGTTGDVEVDPDEDISVAETAGTNTVLADYTTSIECKNQDDAIIDTGTPSGTESRGLIIEEDKIEQGDAIVCTITNTRNQEDEEQRITIIKNTVPDDVEDFKFNIQRVEDQQPGLDFFLDDDGDENNDLKSNRVFEAPNEEPQPGTYRVEEFDVTGWDLTGAACEGTDTEQLNGNVLTFTLAEGDDITCTFTNEKEEDKTGSVKVNKQVDDDGDGTYDGLNVGTDAFKWGLDGEANDNDMGSTQSSVTLGANSVDENDVVEYTFTGWYFNGTDYSCTNPQGTTLPVDILVEADETVEITLCNQKEDEGGGGDDDESSSVKVTKFNDKNQNGVRDSGEETLSGWEIRVTGSDECEALPTLYLVARIENYTCDDYSYDELKLTGASGTTMFTGLKVGVEHTVTETQQEGWKFSGISCIGVETAVTSRENPSAKIYPVAGETVECEIGNYRPEQPKVLGEQTLVNTGDTRALQSMLVGLSLITLTAAVAIATRRQKLTV